MILQLPSVIYTIFIDIAWLLSSLLCNCHYYHLADLVLLTTEDVDGQRGGFDYENNKTLAPTTVDILENNHAFLVNPTIGHRAWSLWLERSTTDWAVDRRVHNSYLLVIRKRRGEMPPLKVNYGLGNAHDTFSSLI